MKKKTILCGLALTAGLALVGCGNNDTPASTTTGGATTGGQTTGGQTTGGQTTGGDSTGSVDPTTTEEIDMGFQWNPLERAGSEYKASGELNIYLNYNAASGVTYRGSTAWSNPVDGKSYGTNALLPAWKGFAEKLNVTINDAASYASKTNDNNYDSLKTNEYKSSTNAEKYVDLFYNTVSNINKMGEEGDAVDLVPYIENGKMPAFAKFLSENPAIEKEITRNGHIYFTPYFDGFQAIERMLVMDTKQVSVLLDDEIPAGLGENVVGTNEAKAKGLLGATKYTPFINATNNYDSDKTVKINKNGEAVDLTIKQTKNIIVQQNELLATGTATGKQLIDQFKAYLDKAFEGQIGAGKTFEKYADIFTSESAAYNTDELVALLRVFKANPDVLYSQVTDDGKWDEVFPVISRGLKSNRVSTFLNFGATLFGIQGVGSEKEKLFIGSDGTLHDGATFKDNYDMLDEMSKLYDEGLIVTDFYKAEKDDEKAFVNRYFAKTIENKSSFGLVMYDYTATQSAPNDKKDGLGTDPAKRNTSPSGISFKNYSVQGISPILSPLTWVRTSADTVDPEQALSDKSGKEIVRYYEENRSIKDTSWCIPKNSTNKDAAVALMDYLWTKEGWNIQNFCTDDYYTISKIFDVDTPTLKTAILDDYSTVVGGDIWNYFRGNLGTAQGIGAYRPTSLDYQATNQYAKKGYNALSVSDQIGVQISSKTRDVSKFSWDTSVPVSIYPTIAPATSDIYKGLTKFWAQDKRSTTADGWANVVVNGGTAAFESVSVTNDGTNDYTMAQLRALFGEKNKNYLYKMAQAIGDDIIPDEAL